MKKSSYSQGTIPASFIAILGIAAGYFALARLSLLLAIPPGYASAIGPTAGMALAAALLWGYRVWFGVWLGSFAANLWIVLNAGNSILSVSTVLAAVIAAGAALQTVLGAYMIFRFVGCPLTLGRGRDIAIFLLLGGPLSCLVNATISVTCLWMAGAISVYDFWFSWFTWWVGDATGAMLLAPVVLSLLVKHGEIWKLRRTTVALPLCLLLFMIVSLYVFVSHKEQQRIENEFKLKAELIASQIKEEWNAHLDALYSEVGFFAASHQVDRDKFRVFARYWLARHKSIQALEWIPRVQHAERSGYEEAARRDGYPGFKITERTKQSLLVERTPQPEYFPVYYVEPFEGNEKALGFDLSSDKNRLSALNQTRTTGKPVGTSRITLVQEMAGQYGFLVFMPVYDGKISNPGEQELREALRGFALGVFRIGDAVRVVVGQAEMRGIRIRLTDLTADRGEQLLYDSISTRLAADHAIATSPGVTYFSPWLATTMEIAERRWQLSFSPTADYLAEHRSLQSWSVLAGGLIFAACACAFLLVVTGRTARIEVLVRERTEALDMEITDRKRAEEALQQSNVRINHLNDVLRTIREVESLITREKDPIELLSAVCDSLLQTRGYVTVWIGKPEADSKRVLMVAHSGAGEDFMQCAPVTWDDSPTGQGPAGTAMRERRAVVFDDLATDPRFAPWRDAVITHGGASIACVPIIHEEYLFGVLTVKADRPHAFDLEEVELLNNLAADLARALQSLENEVARKRAEEEVQRLSRHNQLILDAAGEGIVGLDRAGIVTFINPAGAELAGYRIEEVIQKDFHRMVHHSKCDGTPFPVHECPMFESLTIGVARHERDEVFWRKDGTSFPVAYSSTPILEEGQILGTVLTFRDITLPRLALEELNKYRDRLEDLVKERTAELALANEQLTREIDQRKLTEVELQRAHDELELRVKERTASLQKANEELRQIPSKLIAAQEEERRRLSSELHDSMGQTLAAMKFWIEMVLKLRDEGDGIAALNHLERFVPILQRSIEETRNIYMGLRPSMLDSMGLLATLEWLRGEYMKTYPQCHIEFETEVAEERVPEKLKISIFRIAQEALNNIAKHSKAEWVDISLSKNGDGIKLVVSDDGVGIDLDLVLQASTARSLGLTGMRERAELTGGSFSIESTPGEGTTIRASWPIEAEEQLQ